MLHDYFKDCNNVCNNLDRSDYDMYNRLDFNVVDYSTYVKARNIVKHEELVNKFGYVYDMYVEGCVKQALRKIKGDVYVNSKSCEDICIPQGGIVSVQSLSSTGCSVLIKNWDNINLIRNVAVTARKNLKQYRSSMDVIMERCFIPKSVNDFRLWVFPKDNADRGRLLLSSDSAQLLYGGEVYIFGSGRASVYTEEKHIKAFIDMINILGNYELYLDYNTVVLNLSNHCNFKKFCMNDSADYIEESLKQEVKLLEDYLFVLDSLQYLINKE